MTQNIPREALRAWFRSAARDLPWRRARTPYGTWVSEIMLQQTRVETVVPYFERFMARFPSVRALAEADPEEVRSLWSGLGYYRRAQLMLRAARILSDRYDGELPSDPVALAALPGFGPYTTGAVASLAFDARVPAVDGNIERVLARVHGIEDPRGAAGRRAVWAWSERWVQGEGPGEINEGLIELGATVCSLRKPLCLSCPLRSSCVAQKEGKPERIPPPRKRKAPKRVDLAADLFLDGRSVLLVRQPSDGLFADLWTLPLGPARGGEPLGQVRHLLTHRELSVEVWRGEGATPDGRWVPVADLEGWAIPSLVPKLLEVGLPEAMQVDLRWKGRKFARGPASRR
ncbi:MAG: A/G-specific adenine glycosylase [Myxococcota bacterium]